MADAQERYFLENGSYTHDITELDIDVTANGTTGTTSGTAATHTGVKFPNGDFCFTVTNLSFCSVKGTLSYIQYHKQTANALAGKNLCCAYDNSSSNDDAVCKAAGGKNPFASGSGDSITCYYID